VCVRQSAKDLEMKGKIDGNRWLPTTEDPPAAITDQLPSALRVASE
jgi:hypothetical protein